MAKTYVTFGQIHSHSINDKFFDKDCVAVIECDNSAHGRELAFEYFGTKFCFEYHGMAGLNMSFFPRGLIEVN